MLVKSTPCFVSTSHVLRRRRKVHFVVKLIIVIWSLIQDKVKLGYNELGYNELGCNELGYNELGYNELGYNELGYNTRL